MKLATLRRGGRDGTLIVVDRLLRHAATVPKIARTLQEVLEDWTALAPRLLDVYDRLNAGGIDTSFALRSGELAAPLPRGHVRLVAHASAQAPGSFEIANGASGTFLGPRDPIRLVDARRPIECALAVGALLDDVPLGVEAAPAGAHVRLLVLVHDPVHPDGGGDPASALSPVAATPDELGDAWHDHRVHHALDCVIGGAKPVRCAVAGAVDFSAFVFRATRSRALAAGTILSVPAAPITPERLSLRIGERARIDLRDAHGQSVFGAIEQEVLPAEPEA